MTFRNFLGIKTDETLLNLVRLAPEHRLSARELLEQCMSFVYGSLGTRNNNVTKEQVRQAIIEHQGGVLPK